MIKLMRITTIESVKTLTFNVALIACLLFSARSDANIAGKTILAKGEVIALANKRNNARMLKRRSVIYDVDQITTGSLSKAQFNMADGGLISLKENTKVLISDYRYDKETKKGSATLELVSGGLRSISGLIKKSGGDYQVKTPVGSIGIRGTHFAVQVVGEEVVFGVYSGNIDVTLSNNQVLSLGATEDFAFASVARNGDITTLTQAPKVFSTGFVGDSENLSDTTNENSTANESKLAPTNIENSNLEAIVVDASLYNESNLHAISDEPIVDLISQRSGTLTYDQLIQSSITSSVGATRGFAMTMKVDFDNGSVPGGNLSFIDSQGQWFAAYSGMINVDQLDIGVNFASHNNNKAQGDISAVFSNGLDEIWGRFNLAEQQDPTINASGTFKIRP